MKWVFCIAALLMGCSAPQSATKSAHKPASHLDRASAEQFTSEVYEITSNPVAIEGEVRLVGELVAPVSDDPVPGAIIVHDWGIVGRDGLIAATFGVRLPNEVPVYRALAEGLAAQGVAVLIYDRRNCIDGADLGCSYPASYVEGDKGRPTSHLVDLGHAVRWLDARDDITTVSLIGHGEGARLALIAATDTKTVGDVVLLQPPMTGLQERAKFQIEESIRQIDARIETVGDTPEADLLKQERARLEALDQNDVLGLDEAWLEDLAQIRTLYDTQLSRLERQLLVIEAGVDPGEPASESTRRAEVFGEQLESFPNLSRAMVSVADGDDPTVVAPEIITTLSAFLGAPNAQ